MNYTQDIVRRLLDTHEQRKLGDAARVVALNLARVYPQYQGSFGEQQEQIDEAVAQLAGWELVTADANQQGYYTKIQLNTNKLQQAYSFVQRVPKSIVLQEQKEIVSLVYSRTEGVVHSFCADLLPRLQEGDLPGYGIGKNSTLLGDILLAMEKLEQLKAETYIRNFSEAVFHDSKRFQAIQNVVQNILVDYTEGAVEKKSILEHYNLFTNPSYIFLKGGWVLQCGEKVLDITELSGGIGFPSAALGSITKIQLACDSVISVENLTTYHDVAECEGAIFYLGGFQNSVRTDFLIKLYQDAPNAVYLHKGDLDPYGFLILEILKQKTNIPFQAMEMDLETLRKCYLTGHYRPLELADKKAITSPLLKRYGEIFAFMEQNNCKVEQECFEAMKLGL